MPTRKEAPKGHPLIDIDVRPSQLPEPTWLNHYIPRGTMIRVMRETPLDVEGGMVRRQEKVREELLKAYLEVKDNPSFLDKGRLERLVVAYGLLFNKPSQEGNPEVEVSSEAAAGLHLVKTEFEVDLPPYKIFQEEE